MRFFLVLFILFFQYKQLGLYLLVKLDCYLQNTFDVMLLFTNVPLKETINMIIKRIYVINTNIATRK